MRREDIEDGSHEKAEFVSEVKKIKSVQRRFTKRFLCCCGLQYSERFVKLELDSLELRHVRLTS